MPWYRKLHWQIIAGLVLGIVYGILAASSGWGGFVTDWISPFGTIFINGLKLIAVPLVLASLVMGVASLSDLRKLSRIGGKTIGIYLVTTAVAVTIGLVIVNVLQPGKFIPEGLRDQLMATYADDAAGRQVAAGDATSRGPLQFLVDMVPGNFFASAADNRNMLQVVVMALFLGIGLIIVNVLHPGSFIPEGLRDQLMATYADDAAGREAAAGEATGRGPLQFLVDMVPGNFFASAADNRNMLQVVVMALFLGIGLIQLSEEKAKPLLDFFGSLNDVIIRLVDVIMKIAPVGVFALIAATITSVTGDDPGQVVGLLRGLGVYCMAVLLGLLIQTVVVYPTILKLFSPMGIRTFFAGIGPAQLVAFSTSSSGATLPVTMERCEEKLGVSEEVSSFVLPLGATINMDGTALYQAIAAVFIAQALGLGLGLAAQLTIILTAVLASIGTAAVPGAGVIMLVIILEAIGVPTAGIALILGVDRILDMCRTVTNVTGDATVAVVVAASEGQLGVPDLSEVEDHLRLSAT